MVDRRLGHIQTLSLEKTMYTVLVLWGLQANNRYAPIGWHGPSSKFPVQGYEFMNLRGGGHP